MDRNASTQVLQSGFAAIEPGPLGRALNMPLLADLRDRAGQFVPLSELGEDPAATRHDLEALEAFGYLIERHPYLGAAYRGPSPRLCPDQIEHELGTTRIGCRIAVWNRVESTNDLAARAARAGFNDGLVILAEEQTAGRGQRGRPWSVPPGSSILLSVLVHPPAALASVGADAAAGCAWLTALAAVATAELACELTGRDARIKWPNDVRVEGQKLAGILVERVLPSSSGEAQPGDLPAVVIGVGLNGNVARDRFAEEWRDRSTSLQELLGGEAVDRSEVARDLIRRLDAWYGRGIMEGPDSLGPAWKERSEHLGKQVRLTTSSGLFAGRLVDLDLRCATLGEGASPGQERRCVALASITKIEM